MICAISAIVVSTAQHGAPCGPSCLTDEAEVTWPDAQYQSSAWDHFLIRLIILPGKVGNTALLYPLFPWLAVALFGVVAGFQFREDERKAHRCTLILSVFALAAFVAVRLIGGPGPNLRGWPLDEGSTDVVIAFLSVSKYPPSTAYLLLTLGINGFVLCFLQAMSKSTFRNETCFERAWTLVMWPLGIFGQAPLFFYLLHFWVFAMLSFVLQFTCGLLPIAYVPFPWLFSLTALVFACRRYSAFKATTGPDSIWRLL